MGRVKILFKFLIVLLVVSFLPFNALALPHVVIHFSTGEADLSKGDRKQIKRIIREARRKGKSLTVSSAIWSDEDLPLEGTRLSKTERALASTRERAVRSYLEKHLRITSEIETYNMAERDNWLARFFYSPKKQLEKAMKKTDSLTFEELNLFQKKGGPSEAIVVIKYHGNQIATSNVQKFPTASENN